MSSSILDMKRRSRNYKEGKFMSFISQRSVYSWLFKSSIKSFIIVAISYGVLVSNFFESELNAQNSKLEIEFLTKQPLTTKTDCYTLATEFQLKCAATLQHLSLIETVGKPIFLCIAISIIVGATFLFFAIVGFLTQRNNQKINP